LLSNLLFSNIQFIDKVFVKYTFFQHASLTCPSIVPSPHIFFFHGSTPSRQFVCRFSVNNIFSSENKIIYFIFLISNINNFCPFADETMSSARPLTMFVYFLPTMFIGNFVDFVPNFFYTLERLFVRMVTVPVIA
jgi:hypothetical protein